MAKAKRRGRRPKGPAFQEASADAVRPRSLEELIRAQNARFASLLSLPPAELRTAVRSMSVEDRRSAVLTWIPDEPLRPDLADSFRKGTTALLSLIDGLAILSAEHSDEEWNERYARYANNAYLALFGGTELATQAKRDLIDGIKKSADLMLQGRDLEMAAAVHASVFMSRWPQVQLKLDDFRSAVRAWAAAEKPEKHQAQPARWRRVCELVVATNIDADATPESLQRQWRKWNQPR